jgi:hypothetical protein
MDNNRTIILHYHLFKNAGTSIDSILKDNFDDQWVSKEFKNALSNSAQVTEWIQDNPNAIAFSSHSMMGPIPKINGINIISIVMLRNPVKRIISAYKFERMQNSDNWGAKLARENSFEDYVVTRLNREHDTQCRNFQSDRLATLRPGDGTKAERAIEALSDFSCVGIVEKFEHSLQQITNLVREHYPSFEYEIAHSNRSKLFDFELSPALEQLLQECNKSDLGLWRFANEIAID